MTEEKTGHEKLSMEEMNRMAWNKTIKDILTFIGGCAALLFFGYLTYELFVGLNIRGIFEEHKNVILVYGCGLAGIALVSWWIGSNIIDMKAYHLDEIMADQHRNHLDEAS